MSFTVILHVWSHSLNFISHSNLWIVLTLPTPYWFKRWSSNPFWVVLLNAPSISSALLTTADTEVPHEDELLPGPPSTAISETQKSTRVKCKFTPFITVNHRLISTWDCSHSRYKACLRLRFGVLFHAQSISERDEFCIVTTDPSGRHTTPMQNDTSTLTCYMLVSTIILAFGLDLH